LCKIASHHCLGDDDDDHTVGNDNNNNSGKSNSMQKIEEIYEKLLRTKTIEFEATFNATMLAQAIIDRGILIGAPMNQMLAAYKPELLCTNNVSSSSSSSSSTHHLSWNVAILYPESKQSDLIQGWEERTTIGQQLDNIFTHSPRLPWDSKNIYRRDNIKLCIRRKALAATSSSNQCPPPPNLTKDQLVSRLQDGWDEDAVSDNVEQSHHHNDQSEMEMLTLGENQSLLEVLRIDGHVVPWIPMLYAVPKDGLSPSRKD